jgi:hypothetical protein
MEKWSTEDPYVQRAAVAGLCEPSLMKEPEHVLRVLRILDRATKSLAATSARKDDGFRVLRQALGYCWSVAAAALPEAGRPLLEKWLRSPDKDVAWVMQSNLAKARMSALGPVWLAKWRRKAPATLHAAAKEARAKPSPAAGAKPAKRRSDARKPPKKTVIAKPARRVSR